VTPLETLAELLGRAGDPAKAKLVVSLAAREELKLDDFWQDLAAPAIWAEQDSVASLCWPDAGDAQRARNMLRLIAQDLELRGLASLESSAWFERERAGGS
jgi:hypothetical protein